MINLCRKLIETVSLRTKLKKMLLHSLTKDKKMWRRKYCEADIVWYEYYSPYYGNLQFMIGMYEVTACVLINGRSWATFPVGIPFTKLRKAANQMKRFFDEKTFREMGKSLGESIQLMDSRFK